MEGYCLLAADCANAGERVDAGARGVSEALGSGKLEVAVTQRERLRRPLEGHRAKMHGTYVNSDDPAELLRRTCSRGGCRCWRHPGSEPEDTHVLNGPTSAPPRTPGRRRRC